MAYGRIDVYWPDGPIESYQLDKTSIAIGRSSGNDIVLDTTAVSRYHISLTRQDDDQVVLEDLESVNGTYIEGERINPHEPLVLHGGEEIQLGDIRLVYVPTDGGETPTRPMMPEENLMDTRRIHVAQPNFEIDLDPPTDPVTPGAYIQATLTVTNLKKDNEIFAIDVNGIPREWVRVDRLRMEIEPGGRATAVISFKPLRRSESAPGTYPIVVRVAAENGDALEAPLQLAVRSFSGFGMMLAETKVSPESPFDLHVHNQGSGSLSLNFSGATPGGGLAFEFQSSNVTLAPGEHRTLHGLVRPVRRPLVGATRTRRFDILARSQDASGFLAAVEGSVVERPLLPVWVPTVLIPMILLALVIGAVAIMAIIGRPRTPIFTALAASAASISDGDPVTLTWTVTNADTMAIRLDNGAPVSVDPKTGSYSQAVTGSGEHIFTVEARNGGESVKQDVRIVVNPPLRINAFTVTPNPLLRYIRQQVTIQWDVEGADSVRFLGIEALTGKPDENKQPPTGQILLDGTPRDTVELKLVALGTNGKQIDQSIRVEIANPACAIKPDVAEVHSGPGDAYPVMTALTINTIIMPDGRDPAGGWVHLVPTADDPQSWLPISALTCPDFKPESLTVITAIPPIPTPTHTPIPPTATNTPVPPTAVPTVPTVAPTVTRDSIRLLNRQ
jgi:hypothetical protein